MSLITLISTLIVLSHAHQLTVRRSEALQFECVGDSFVCNRRQHLVSSITCHPGTPGAPWLCESNSDLITISNITICCDDFTNTSSCRVTYTLNDLSFTQIMGQTICPLVQSLGNLLILPWRLIRPVRQIDLACDGLMRAIPADGAVSSVQSAPSLGKTLEASLFVPALLSGFLLGGLAMVFIVAYDEWHPLNGWYRRHGVPLYLELPSNVVLKHTDVAAEPGKDTLEVLQRLINYCGRMAPLDCQLLAGIKADGVAVVDNRPIQRYRMTLLAKNNALIMSGAVVEDMRAIVPDLKWHCEARGGLLIVLDFSAPLIESSVQKVVIKRTRQLRQDCVK